MCWKCPEPLDGSRKIGFRDACPSCGADLHVCRNCVFYDPGANHDCREDSADPVSDKERMNLCEYFRPKVGLSSAPKVGKKDARSDFEKLFGGS